METSFETPILFVIFNRPDITQQVFNRIKEVKPKYLYIAADGPRENHPKDLIDCKGTREITNQIDWPCELKTLFRNKNIGCGLGVCTAINWFFEQVEEGIILEDDCLPDISFFSYCNELLSKYREDKNIFFISGTNMQNGLIRGHASYFFSNYTFTLGWASWRRAWNFFNYDIPDVDESLKNGALCHVFQSAKEKKYWTAKLAEARKLKLFIWDYQWFYSVWKNNGIGITPNSNLVLNLGYRNNATHDSLRDSIREPSITEPIKFPLVHPNYEIDRIADKFTFKHALSHSPTRCLRLLKENNTNNIIKYAMIKMLSILQK